MLSIERLQEAGETLKCFCDEEGYPFLNKHGGLDHGFLDGGCKLLADALLTAASDSLPNADIYWIGRSGQDTLVDHVAVSFVIDGTRMFLDANGLQDEVGFKQNLLDELKPHERNCRIEIGCFDEEDEVFMESVEESGFALYPDLDLVRKKLVVEFERIGFSKLLSVDTPEEIYYTIERDDDDEGTFSLAFSRQQKDDDGDDLCIAHLHVPDDEVRSESFGIGDIDVNPDRRREGIATALLDRMAAHLDLKPYGAASVFSKEGGAFWEGHRNKKDEMPAQHTPTVDELRELFAYFREKIEKCGAFPKGLQGACGAASLLVQATLDKYGIEGCTYVNNRHSFTVAGNGMLIDLTATQISQSAFAGVEISPFQEAVKKASGILRGKGFYNTDGKLLFSGDAEALLTIQPHLPGEHGAIERLVGKVYSILGEASKLPRPISGPDDEHIIALCAECREIMDRHIEKAMFSRKQPVPLFAANDGGSNQEIAGLQRISR